MAMIFALGIIMLLAIFGMALFAKYVQGWLTKKFLELLRPKRKATGGAWFEEVHHQ